MSEDQVPVGARIPANVDAQDKILGPLTVRQVGLLAVVAVLLYAAWTATRPLVPAAVFLVLGLPIVGGALAVVLGRRDGISADRWLWHAAAFGMSGRASRRQVMVGDQGTVPPVPGIFTQAVAGQDVAPPGPLHLPLNDLEPGEPGEHGEHGEHGEPGVGLGADGVAVVAGCSTVNFALRTTGEQAGLVGGFARWLNTLGAPVQIVVRAGRLDLEPLIAGLEDGAPGLAHPALEQAALAHAGWLRELAAGRDLLTRQALLAVRDPGGNPARAGRVLAEAVRALPAAEVRVQPLDQRAAGELLAAISNPTFGPDMTGDAGGSQGSGWGEA